MFIKKLLYESSPKSHEVRMGFCFCFGRVAWHAELPRPGIEPMSPAVEAWSRNHWTTRELQGWCFCTDFIGEAERGKIFCGLEARRSKQHAGGSITAGSHSKALQTSQVTSLSSGMPPCNSPSLRACLVPATVNTVLLFRVWAPEPNHQL